MFPPAEGFTMWYFGKRVDKTRAKGYVLLEEYFAQYVGFKYDSTRSPTEEFRRLCRYRQMGKGARRDAREEFQLALVKEFNGLYGTDEFDIRSWQVLFRVLGLAPIPESVPECKKVRR
jgi:hypothetical protein